MIRFKCIYCGQRIRTRDENGGKKAKCPKCKGIITIPATDNQTAGLSEAVTIQQTESNEPIGLGNIKFCEEIEEDYEEKWYRFIIPRYDELSVFLIGATFIAMTAINGEMRKDLWNFIKDDWRSIFLVLFGIIFACLCIIYPFSRRKKGIEDKWLMLGVAVIINGGTGIAAGQYLLDKTIGWQVIFPTWNIINGILLLAMLRLKAIDYRSISDRDTNRAEIIIGVIIITAIYIIFNFIYKQYWAVTFSIIIVFATSFSNAIGKVFPGRQQIVSTQSSENEAIQ